MSEVKNWKWKPKRRWIGIFVFWLISIGGAGVIARSGGSYGDESGFIIFTMLIFAVWAACTDRSWSIPKRIIWVFGVWIGQGILTIPVMFILVILLGDYFTVKPHLFERAYNFFAALLIVVWAMWRSKFFVEPVVIKEETQEEERLRRQQEKQEQIAKEKEEKIGEENEWTLKYKFIAVALVLAIMALGYWALAPGTSDSPTVMQTPEVTAASSTPIIAQVADQNTITNSIGMEFVLIPAGEFDMGSPLNEKDRDNNEGPIHHVKISNAFYMGKYEVTQKQWRDVMGKSPSNFKGNELPVESVSWNDVQDFINTLNEKEGGNKYRLPTEAEWEYAARARTTTQYSFDKLNLGDFGWDESNSMAKTHDVGQKKPNPWGLYDMHGNVWEWVQDKWHDDYNGAPTDGSSWESGDSSNRVNRGGSWDNDVRRCRSSNRCSDDPGLRFNYLGFRLLRVS